MNAVGWEIYRVLVVVDWTIAIALARGLVTR